MEVGSKGDEKLILWFAWPVLITQMAETTCNTLVCMAKWLTISQRVRC
jgi:hypothetical protein